MKNRSVIIPTIVAFVLIQLFIMATWQTKKAHANAADPLGVRRQATREIDINGQKCSMTVIELSGVDTVGFHIVCPNK